MMTTAAQIFFRRSNSGQCANSVLPHLEQAAGAIHSDSAVPTTTGSFGLLENQLAIVAFNPAAPAFIFKKATNPSWFVPDCNQIAHWLMLSQTSSCAPFGNAVNCWINVSAQPALRSMNQSRA